MKLSDFDWEILPIHTVVSARMTYSSASMDLMWRGYGRFTNLTTGTEWFVEGSMAEIDRIIVPTFTLGG